MSKKKPIKERLKLLAEKEKQIKDQIDETSEEAKGKAMRVGKIALISGIFVLMAYWIYNVFSSDEEQKEESKPQPKHRSGPSTSSRIIAVLTPYVKDFLTGLIEEKEDKEEKS